MPRAISKSGKLTNRMRSTKENELTDNPFICLKNIGEKTLGQMNHILESRRIGTAERYWATFVPMVVRTVFS
jgi:hypothetical protein